VIVADLRGDAEVGAQQSGSQLSNKFLAVNFGYARLCPVMERLHTWLKAQLVGQPLDISQDGKFVAHLMNNKI